MASVAASNNTNLTAGITGSPPRGSGLTWPGGVPVVAFRIAAGQLSGDTAVLSDPVRLPIIKAVSGPVTHNLPASGASSVTVTLSGVFTSAVSNTIGAVDVWLIGPQPLT
jgi:hypothetical protein